MFGKFFGRKRQEKRAESTSSGMSTSGYSVEAMLGVARRNALFDEEGEFPMIPELLPVFSKASKFFLTTIQSAPPMYLETFMHHSCRYLWGKSVEAAFLWAKSPDGNISINFEPGEMAREILTTELPQHLEKIVLSSLDGFLPYFKAHQQAMMANQHSMRPVQIQKEITDTLEYLPRIGLAYAISKGYHETRW